MHPFARLLVLAVATSVVRADPQYVCEINPAIDPFVTPTAKERAREFIKLPEGSYELLFQVEKYSMSVTHDVPCPYPNPADCSEGPYGSITREISFDGSFVTRELISAVKAMERSYDHCDPFKISAAIQSISSRRVKFGGGFHGEDRDCGWFFGEYKNVKCSYQGQWTQSLDLMTQTVPVNRGRKCDDANSCGTFDFKTPNAAIDVTDRKCLGGLVDPDTFLGRLIYQVLIEIPASSASVFGIENPSEKLREALSQLRRATAGFQQTLALNLGDAATFRKGADQLDKTGRGFYVDDKRTRFESLSEGVFSFVYAETAYFPESDWMFDTVCKAARSEVELLDKLDEDGKEHVVQRGENLWKLARGEYGRGELHYFIQHTNSLRTGKILVGQKVILDPIWKLAAYQAKNLVVQPGDCVWKKTMQRGPGVSERKWDPSAIPVPFGSADVDEIFPGQVLTLNEDRPAD